MGAGGCEVGSGEPLKVTIFREVSVRDSARKNDRAVAGSSGPLYSALLVVQEKSVGLLCLAGIGKLQIDGLSARLQVDRRIGALASDAFWARDALWKPVPIRRLNVESPSLVVS